MILVDQSWDSLPSKHKRKRDDDNDVYDNKTDDREQL